MKAIIFPEADYDKKPELWDCKTCGEREKEIYMRGGPRKEASQIIIPCVPCLALVYFPLAAWDRIPGFVCRNKAFFDGKIAMKKREEKIVPFIRPTFDKGVTTS